METQTQQQTNQYTETIVTVQKFRHQKGPKYRPRKWRGNTLVPVIIALAISAIATIAFLTQGANLAADNKRILAQNQIASILGEWSMVTSTLAIADIAQDNLPLIENNPTIYGLGLTFTPCAEGGCSNEQPNILFVVDTEDNCNALRRVVTPTLNGVRAVNCQDIGATTTLRITLN